MYINLHNVLSIEVSKLSQETTRWVSIKVISEDGKEVSITCFINPDTDLSDDVPASLLKSN